MVTRVDLQSLAKKKEKKPRTLGKKLIRPYPQFVYVQWALCISHCESVNGRRYVMTILCSDWSVVVGYFTMLHQLSLLIIVYIKISVRVLRNGITAWPNIGLRTQLDIISYPIKQLLSNWLALSLCSLQSHAGMFRQLYRNVHYRVQQQKLLCFTQITIIYIHTQMLTIQDLNRLYAILIYKIIHLSHGFTDII